MKIRYCLGVLAVAVASFAFSRTTQADSVQTKADSSSNKILYVDVSLNDVFMSEGANPYLSLSNYSIVDLTPVDDGVYQTTEAVSSDIFSDSSFGLRVCCFDESEPTMTSVTVQGGSSLKDSLFNYLCLGESTPGENPVIEGFGHYGGFTEDPGATYETQRVWLSADIDDLDAWGDYKRFAIGYDSEAGFRCVVMTHLINTFNNQMLFFGDIPAYTSSIIFLSISGEDNHPIIYDHINVDRLSYGVCYSPIDSFATGKVVAPITIKGATALTLKHAFEAFLTLGKDDSNGSTTATVINLFNTWYENKSATKEELKDVKLLDYTGYSANGNSYVGLIKSVSYSIWDKWSGLCTNAGIDMETGKAISNWFSGFGLSNMKTSLLILLGACGVLGVLYIGVLLARKKKDC